MENIISQTLLLPLYFRAIDAKNKNSTLNDTWAVELVKKFDYDFKTMDKAKFSQAGTIARASYFDRKAKDFIENNPRPIIINMATGLDTRTLRIYNEKAKFYDIDLPEVIELRKKYIEDKSTVISADAFTDEFNSELLQNKNSQFCFIFEGFFMYFDKFEIEKLLKNLVENFNGTILGDFSFGYFWEKNQAKHDVLKENEARFKTSFEDIQDLLHVDKKLKLKEQKFYYDKDFANLFGWRRFLMLLTSKKMKTAMRLVELEF